MFFMPAELLPDGILPLEAWWHRLGVTAGDRLVAALAASSQPRTLAPMLKPVRWPQEEGRRVWHPVLA